MMKTHRQRATRQITENTVRVIREMAIAGRTQTDIAEYLGVSKIAVWRVLNGKEVQLAATQVKRRYDYGTEPPRHQGVASKCMGCGARVFKPCMVCEMRSGR